MTMRVPIRRINSPSCILVCREFETPHDYVKRKYRAQNDVHVTSASIISVAFLYPLLTAAVNYTGIQVMLSPVIRLSLSPGQWIV
jgi:hypothetical protein